MLADVLVTQASERSGGGERLPEVGPSFRDVTRVAGANPAIWGDILAANREALAAEVEAPRRGPEVAACCALATASGSAPGTGAAVGAAPCSRPSSRAAR